MSQAPTAAAVVAVGGPNHGSREEIGGRRKEEEG